MKPNPKVLCGAACVVLTNVITCMVVYSMCHSPVKQGNVTHLAIIEDKRKEERERESE